MVGFVDQEADEDSHMMHTGGLALRSVDPVEEIVELEIIHFFRVHLFHTARHIPVSMEKQRYQFS